MTLKHKGEFEVELGIGIPKYSTIDRLAYNPSEDGYILFDTDLKIPFYWDKVTQVWVKITTGNKISTLNGLSQNKLTVKNTTQTSDLNIKAASGLIDLGVVGTPELENSSPYFVELGNNSPASNYYFNIKNRMAFNTSSANPLRIASAVSNDLTVKTTGKWYWETGFDGLTNVLNKQGSWGSGIYFGDRQRGNSTDDGGLSTARSKYTQALPRTVSSNSEAAIVYNEDFVNGGAEAVTFTSNDIYGDDVAATMPGTENPLRSGAIIRHRVDLDAGTYEIAHGDTEWLLILENIQSGIKVRPFLFIIDNTQAKIMLEYSDMTYNVPEGFFTYDGFGLGGGFSIKSDNDLIIGKNSATSISFNSSNITTTNPIIGVDSADPASLVTKNYSDNKIESSRYSQTFTTSDWIVNGSEKSIEVSQSTHGLPTTSTTSYLITVTKLVNDSYEIVQLQTTIHATTGLVTIKIVGEVFDGIIVIANS